MARVAVVFGQFGAAADPVNLPHFNNRLHQAGIETILVQHTDSQKVFDFLRSYNGWVGIVGASLGAGAAAVFAGYMKPKSVDFIGGFQPSDYDPVMYRDPDTGLMTVNVPSNVKHALCFRNPNPIETGGLGHAVWKLAHGNANTSLIVVERHDVHPGDFGESQDQMVTAILDHQHDKPG